MKKYDFVIIGAGIIGLSLAYILKSKHPQAKIIIIEKESDVGKHASGLNSGVIHAGIYYARDSNKAKFCIEGNRLLREFCHEHKLSINNCGKLIVSKDEKEEYELQNLYNKGVANGAQIELINNSQMQEVESLAKTYDKAIYSPNTASIDPVEVCQKLKNILQQDRVIFAFGEKVVKIDKSQKSLKTKSGEIYGFGMLINCAGLYADAIWRAYSEDERYMLIPFKGLYLKSKTFKLKTNVYPVPNPAYPFLGVHFTVNSENITKIGPTALPALWREQYKGISNFSTKELLDITSWYVKAISQNYSKIRKLIKMEAKYLFKNELIKEAEKLIRVKISDHSFSQTHPGIRAQLFDKHEKKLVDDFVLKQTNSSLHILNAVSPAFTCAFAIAKDLARSF